MAIKKSELYGSLWASCDELRGGMDASQYKDYVLALVVDDKWIATLHTAIHGEMDRISQQLATRVKELAERYASPLPKLTNRVAELEAKVNVHLEKMGFAWT